VSGTSVHAARSCIQLVGRCALRTRDSGSCASIQGSTGNTGWEVVGSIRISQSRKRGARAGVYEKTQQGMKDVEEIVPSTADEPLSSEPTHVRPSSLLHANELRGETTVVSMLLEPSSFSTTVSQNRQDSTSCNRALHACCRRQPP
jgi:hypothetical protein